MNDFIVRYQKVLFTLLTVCSLITMTVLFAPDIAFSQPGPPILPDGPEQTPIDGGLGILAALGGAYAINKLRDEKN